MAKFDNVFEYIEKPSSLASIVDDVSLPCGLISNDEVSIVGRDHWLYLYKGSNNYYKAYSEEPSTAIIGADEWLETIDSYSTWFKRRSIRFLPVIIPNKATVIPDNYPLELPSLITPRLRFIRNSSLKEIYCPINHLHSISTNRFVFRKLDTHMSEYGNIYFVLGILEALGIDWHGIRLLAEVVSIEHKGDLGWRYDSSLVEKVSRFRFKEDSKVVVHELAQPVAAHTGLIYESFCLDAPINAKLLVFGNSFFEKPTSWAMAPFLCRIFRNVRFHWESGVYEQYIDDFEPDFAIFQTCERFLTTLPRLRPFSEKYYQSRLIDQLKASMNTPNDSNHNFYLNIVTKSDQTGNAFIGFNHIGKVGPDIPFPLYQLPNHEEHLIKDGITVVSEDGVSVSSLDVSDYKKHYLSKNRIIDKLQASIVAGKWALWAYRPKKDGYIETDFGVVLPTFLNGKEFTIKCEGVPPVETHIYYDRHLGATHWFMPAGCVIGIRCRFKLEHLQPYLHFKLVFSDSSLTGSGESYRTLATFTDTKMLDGLPDTKRIQRVASKNANQISFLNGGRTAYLALMEIAKNEGIDLNRAGVRVMDWGVGCGRVARHFIENSNICLTGIDIDKDNVDWCSANLYGTYIHVYPDPPTQLLSNSFDLIYSCSVLSHLTEADATKWLNELARLLSDNGVALLSYNGLSNSASYLSRRPLEFQRVLNRQLFDSDINHELDGFIPRKNYYRASFASDEWWLAMFEKHFQVSKIEHSVVNGYQHIVVLRKRVTG